MSPSALLLVTAAAAGQPPAPPRPMPATRVITLTQGPAVDPAPAAPPAPMPNGTAAPAEAPSGSAPTYPSVPAGEAAPASDAKSSETPADEPAAEEADKWFVMRRLEGTALGTLLDEKRVSISGWTQLSHTWSTTDVSNSPVVWNDRADKFLLNQLWLRLDKAVDTDAKHATFGYRVDAIYGSDYRFTLQRDLFDDQLVNSNGDVNLYGADLIQFYLNAYLPNLFQGTDVKVGRLFTPFGYESLEGVSTPFVSRSYAFNWAPPFTHMGIQVSPKFNDQWSGKFMFANGNDVFFGSADEPRFVGAVTYTPDDDNSVTFGTSLGRGKFNSALGQNHINVFDLVWTHKLSDKLSYAFESIYGYQWGVPTTDFGGPLIDPRRTNGTANWYSVVQYLNYQVSDNLLGVARLELFEDVQGARTGFEGLYTAFTLGAAWTPIPDVIVRPHWRYDINNRSNPFEGKNNIHTGAIEMIFRF